MNIGLYFLRVLLPVGVVTIVPLVIVANIATKLDASFANLVIVTLMSMIVTVAVIAIWGLTPSERKNIIQTITNKIKR